MAGSKTGTSTIVHLVHRICKMVATYGAADLVSRTNSSYAAAVFALVAACQAFEALDNTPYQIDRQAPFGPEDIH